MFLMANIDNMHKKKAYIFESNLRKKIRQILLENNLDERITTIIDKLNNLGNSRILIESLGNSGFYVSIFAKKQNIANVSFMLADRKERKGQEARRFVKSGSIKRRAYQVAHAKAIKGFGTLAYEIGLEIVSGLLMEPGALLPDRRYVSKPAKKVWDIYFNRARIDSNLHAVKMDIDDITVKKSKVNPGINILQMTPDIKEDDLRQDSALDYLNLNNNLKNIEWKDVNMSLSYAFYKDRFEVLSYINSKKNIEIIYNLD